MEATGQKTPLQAWWRTALYGRNLRVTLLRSLALVAVSLVTFKLLLVPIRVTGVSMLPTYKDHSINFVNRLAYLWHEPRRGDVVAIRTKAGKHVMYMKRIVGLPGETIAFHGGHIVINGRILEEPYLKYSCDWEHEAQTIGPNKYYVVGDNRSMGWYEHEQGMAERECIVGKLLL